MIHSYFCCLLLVYKGSTAYTQCAKFPDCSLEMLYILYSQDCWWGMYLMKKYHMLWPSLGQALQASSGPKLWKLDNVLKYSIIRSCYARYRDYETILDEGKYHSQFTCII